MNKTNNILVSAGVGLSIFSILILYLATGCNNSTTAPPMEAGAAIVEITPPVGYPRYGYPVVISTGVKDPLNARALVFKQGDIQGAILVCELLGIPRDLSRIVREKASKATGIPFQHITVSATHSHTSPAITQDFQEYANREASGKLTDEDKNSYFSLLIENMTRAIISAYENLKQVEIVSGIGQAPGIQFNRRYLMTNGRVLFNPGRLNPKIVRPVGPVDPRVHFVLFKPLEQKSYSTSLTVFGSHYVRGGTEFSADYPYFLQERLKNIFGDQIISVFGLGPCGDVNTVDVMKKSDPSVGENEYVKIVGNTLADAIETALPEAKKRTPDLKISSKTIYLPLQNYTEDELKWSKEGTEPLYPERAFLEKRRKLKISVWGVQPPLEQMRKNEAIPPVVSGEPWMLPVEIHAFQLDSQTAIVTLPGELFAQLGIDLKKRSPYANTMLIELSNADIAYMPTKQGFSEGDYEALNSRLMPGSGEKMIDAAIEMLTELRQ